MEKIALSGIQTSGRLHIGNYLGSIKNWLDIQDSYQCYFFLADLHAITVPQDPKLLQQSILHSAAIYLASGINPDTSALFLQSHVKEHCELAWLLNCVTPIGWLQRMTQFKDKAGKKQESAGTGLFTYPVLMAADILLYDADIVPVGDDQKQHLELTRDIAEVINRKFNSNVLKVPDPMIQGCATRIMSLRDGTKKMSKSDESDASRINLTDDVDSIVRKIQKARTDAIAGITFDPINRPEITNLINIFCSLSDMDIKDIVDRYQNKNFSLFKKDLSDLIITHLQPIQTEFNKLIQDKSYIESALHKGAIKAQRKASVTCDRVKQKFGFI